MEKKGGLSIKPENLFRWEVIYMKGTENCWEFKKCGREPGGRMADKLGVCPVAIATYANGLNRGMNGGRICWAIDGSCDRKIGSCIHCDFFNLLEEEELEGHISLNRKVDPEIHLRVN